MLDLKKLDGPYGIPVYHQKMPEGVKTVSMCWLVFTGAADDLHIGHPGLHHWFEHVPFRGTKNYPRGVADIERPLAILNGSVNAWTSLEATCYRATVHKDQWNRALSTITDLVSNPLITDEAVEAERQIIHQEIVGNIGSADSYANYLQNSIVFGGHPFGHHTLGSEESLARMDATSLRRAHSLGYDRSRCVFICVGDIEDQEILEAVNSVGRKLPDRGISWRRKPAYFGALPAWKPGKTVIETSFPSSIVTILFPTATNDGEAGAMLNAFRSCLLKDNLFCRGGLDSPLMRTLREERHLVYGCSTEWSTYAGGGYFGFTAEAKRKNIDAILQAFDDVLHAPELRSAERLEMIKSGNRACIEMNPIDPDEYRKAAARLFINQGGQLNSEAELIEMVNRITLDDVDATLSELHPEDAHIIILEGKG